MTNWNKLPQEIKSQIGYKIYYASEDKSWRHANRELYDLYQLHHYETISKLHFDEENTEEYKEIENIFNSPFNPGRYIKHINTLYIKVPLISFYKSNVTADPLYRFMFQCPNVTHISKLYIDENIGESAELWAYFQEVLLESRIWKLEGVPEPQEIKTYAAHYFHIAYYMRNTITKLTLTSGMITDKEDDRLNKLHHVKSLTVMETVCATLFDLKDILNHLPQLEELYIKGFTEVSKIRDHSSSPSDYELDTERKAYKNIKSLEFDSYLPSTNQEMLFIQHGFPNIKYLELFPGAYQRGWPTADMSKPLLASFLRYILGLESHKIHINRLSNDQFPINLYYSTLHSLNIQHSELTVIFVKKSEYYQQNTLCSISSHKKNKYKSTPHLNIYYVNPRKQHARVLEVLSNINKSVNTLSLNFNSFHVNCSSYINMILKHNTRVKELCILSGKLSTYSVENCVASILEKLNFSYTMIDADTAFPLLSNDIQHLEELLFYSCSFTAFKTINIWMDNTSVEKLWIHDSLLVKEDTMPVLLSVSILQQDATNYYANYADSTIQLNQNRFNQLKLRFRDCVVISARFKNINHFKLNASCLDTNEFREINISF